MKSLVEDAAALVSLSPVLSPVRRRALRGTTNIVYYHYIGPDVPYYADFATGCTLERFAQDLETLREHFRFASLAQVIAGRDDAKKPLLALTFDDGFDLIASGVADVLELYGATATTFVITSCIDNEALMWRNKLSVIRALVDESVYVARYNELMRERGYPPVARGRMLQAASLAWPAGEKDELADALWASCDLPPVATVLAEYRPYFTWEGLERWLERGHDVGLHTATHPMCSRLDAAGIHAEIVEPAQLLRRRLGLESVPFSYPFGRRLPEAVERELYEQGVFSCAVGINGFAAVATPPYRLERACAEQGLGLSVFGRALLGPAAA